MKNQISWQARKPPHLFVNLHLHMANTPNGRSKLSHPWRDPFSSGSQSHSRSDREPRCSWSSVSKCKHSFSRRIHLPKPCPWVFQCPNFMLVVMTYKSLLNLFLKQGGKITLYYFKGLQIFQIWPKAMKTVYFPNHKPHSLLKSNCH